MIPTIGIIAPFAGLALGSYAVTQGIRLARGGPWPGRSVCDACATPLGFAQTAPVVSYLILRGRCAACQAAIPKLHLAGELAGAAIVAASVLLVSPLRAALLTALGLVLVTASSVDVARQRLPNPLTFAAAALSLVLAALGGTGSLAMGAAAALLTGMILLALRELRRRRASDGDPGLGLGDVKLFAGLALWLGAATPWALVAAASLGLVGWTLGGRGSGRIAFGPALAAGSWAVGVARDGGLIPWLA